MPCDNKAIRTLAHDLSHSQLTQEQREAYANAKASYYQATGKFFGTPSKEEQLSLYIDIFNLLAKYVGDVVSENYLLLFATVTQELQDEGIEVGREAIDKKTEIYLKFIKEFQNPRIDDDFYEHMLDKMYIRLGFIFLEGSEISKNDTVAHLMFEVCKNRGFDTSEMLRKFVKISDGEWRFCE